ncbi:MAG TPA: RidA family protein [Ramlibacter sp.]|nr:RidA family protein [Ramlibacter sp.]
MSLNTRINPATMAPPIGAYSQGVAASGAGTWLHVSGQVGIRPDGSLAEGIEEQADAAWRNVIAVLEAADMTIAHLVKITTLLVEVEHVAPAGRVRAKYLGDARPASTVAIVKSLVKPEFLFEVEAVAFRPLPSAP